MNFPITINSPIELFRVLDELTNEEGLDLRPQDIPSELEDLWKNAPYEEALRRVNEAMNRGNRPRAHRGETRTSPVPESVRGRLKRYELRAKCWGKALGVLRRCRSLVGAPHWDKAMKHLPDKYQNHWVVRAVRGGVVRDSNVE